MECEQESIPKLSDGNILNDSLTHISRLRHYLTLNVSKAVRDTEYLHWSTNSDLHTPYSTVLFQMILSDLVKYSVTRSIARFLCDSRAACTINALLSSPVDTVSYGCCYCGTVFICWFVIALFISKITRDRPVTAIIVKLSEQFDNASKLQTEFVRKIHRLQDQRSRKGQMSGAIWRMSIKCAVRDWLCLALYLFCLFLLIIHS